MVTMRPTNLATRLPADQGARSWLEGHSVELRQPSGMTVPLAKLPEVMHSLVLPAP